jgi:hypothetical protein
MPSGLNQQTIALDVLNSTSIGRADGDLQFPGWSFVTVHAHYTTTVYARIKRGIMPVGASESMTKKHPWGL